FLDKTFTAHHRTVLEAVAAAAREGGIRCVCLVSTFRVHFGDRDASQTEADALRHLEGLPTRVVILRPSHVASRTSRLGSFLRRFWFCFPFLPGRLQGCCVEGDDLFRVIDQELARKGSRLRRTYTLLGANRSWQTRLRENRTGRLGRTYVALMNILVPLS